MLAESCMYGPGVGLDVTTGVGSSDTIRVGAVVGINRGMGDSLLSLDTATPIANDAVITRKVTVAAKQFRFGMPQTSSSTTES